MGKHIGDEFYIICSTNPFTAILVNIQEICIIHWGNYSIHQSKCGSRVNNSFCFLRFFLELFHLHLQLLFPTCEQLFHFLCTLSLFTKPHSKSTWFQDAHCLFFCWTQHSKLSRFTVCIMNLEHSGLQSHNSDQLIRLLKGSLVIETLQHGCRQLCSTSFFRT